MFSVQVPVLLLVEKHGGLPSWKLNISFSQRTFESMILKEYVEYPIRLNVSVIQKGWFFLKPIVPNTLRNMENGFKLGGILPQCHSWKNTFHSCLGAYEILWKEGKHYRCLTGLPDCTRINNINHLVHFNTHPMSYMQGICTCIYHESKPNVDRYTMHGWC